MELQGGVYGNAVPPEPGRIFHIQAKNYPNMRFEWHPVTQKVYVIRLIEGQTVQTGELVAFNIGDHGAAQNAVLIWLRGYRTRDQERQRNPALKAEDY